MGQLNPPLCPCARFFGPLPFPRVPFDQPQPAKLNDTPILPARSEPRYTKRTACFRSWPSFLRDLVRCFLGPYTGYWTPMQRVRRIGLLTGINYARQNQLRTSQMRLLRACSDVMNPENASLNRCMRRDSAALPILLWTRSWLMLAIA
jgi:hypothetical protein